ncbi:MAG: alpha-ketoglutarate-dependent dioxygenase AlkB [Xanthomonadales bacterium]|nr:alpha-ketoglutarate-dependent dioxygenase AlkB [Xanthomonadales bacterium]
MSPERNILPGVSVRPGWLNCQQAKTLLDTLWRDLDWRQDPVQIFGRKVLQPRLTAWCSDPEVVYTYSGLRLDPVPWHPSLSKLREKLARALDLRFNSVLANAYRTGSDAMGWHSDDEPELGSRPSIASISLGATRRFLVRPKRGQSKPRRSTGIDLANGDLLLMEHDSQKDFQHCLARTRKPAGLRINLTFRNILA